MSRYVDAASARPIVDARRRGVDEFMRGVKRNLMQCFRRLVSLRRERLDGTPFHCIRWAHSMSRVLSKTLAT